MQSERRPETPRLCSLAGFQFADWLLSPVERTAWGCMLASSDDARDASLLALQDRETPHAITLGPCAEVEERAAEWFKCAMPTDSLLDIALDHLTLARATLYRAMMVVPIAGASHSTPLGPQVATALERLRLANILDHLPKALLTAALYHATLGADPEQARRLLAEAEQIAERGPMPLYLADVHLHRARLFRDRSALAEARVLIEKHGYGRRRDELADAEAAAAGWPDLGP